METNNEIKGFNIAEALKYAPKGLKLYTPLFGEVRFIKVFQDTILANTLRDIDATFFQDGRYYNYNNTECLLFPSINHRCWNHWQNTLFPESIGSVCVDTITGNKFILDHNGTFFSDGTGSLYSTLIEGEDSGNYLLNSCYATPEEAKEFFEELEKNGYEWDGKKVVKNKEYYSMIFKNQDVESSEKKVKPTLEEMVNILADEILALKQRVLALEIQVIKDMSTPPMTKDPYFNSNKITCDDAQCYKGKSASEVFEIPDKAGDNVTLEEMKG